mgnify:FL=1|jgi:hypothetical protein
MAYMYHIRYAEILYTLGCGDKGTPEQLRSARKYFAHALELNPQGNTRALFGLLLCCAALSGSKKGAKERDTSELVPFVHAKLLEAYGQSPMRPMLVGVLSPAP